jgi:hypothetical protein
MQYSYSAIKQNGPYRNCVDSTAAATCMNSAI